MAKNRKNAPSLDAASSNPVVRVVKALIERYSSDLGKAAVSTEVVQAGVQQFKASFDGIFGQGTASAALNSKLVEAGVVGVVNLPWFPRFLANLIGVDPDLADDIVQEGVDSLLRSSIEEMAKLPMANKSDDEVRKILAPHMSNLKQVIMAQLEKNNRAGLEKVWFDPETSLAHKVGCKTVGSKTGLLKDVNLIATEKLHGGRMTAECACVEFDGDKAGSLDTVLARMSPHMRNRVLEYIATFPEHTKILTAGNKRRDITVAKLKLVLEIGNAALKKTQFFQILGYEEGKKPSIFDVGRDLQAQATAVITDRQVGHRFAVRARATTETNNYMARLIRRG